MDGQNELPAELQIWESFREEYIESVFILLSMMSARYSWIFFKWSAIDQLPLSLHRSFTLLRQFDTQSYGELYLAVRQIVSLTFT